MLNVKNIKVGQKYKVACNTSKKIITVKITGVRENSPCVPGEQTFLNECPGTGSAGICPYSKKCYTFLKEIEELVITANTLGNFPRKEESHA